MKNNTGIGAAFALTLLSIACGSFGSDRSSGNANAPGGASPTSASNTAAPTSTATFRKPDFTVEPVALHDAYDKSDKSVEKYKDKIVEITGKYKRTVGSNAYLHVVIDSGKNREVWCKMAEGYGITVSQYKEGQTIKLTGIGDPLVYPLGPGFKDCKLQP